MARFFVYRRPDSRWTQFFVVPKWARRKNCEDVGKKHGTDISEDLIEIYLKFVENTF